MPKYELHEVERAVLELLDEPGSLTYDRLLKAVAEREDISERAAKFHAGNLLAEAIIGEKEQFDGVYEIKNDPR